MILTVSTKWCESLKERVDIVFANAGVVDPVSLAESTPQTFDKHFNLNARGDLEQRTRLHRQPSSLLPKRAASSLASTCRLMVAQFPDNPAKCAFRTD
jgi:NAD(P)-dependent dehydrogenase (short-subunit alcohol dehydrogenase family)